METFTPFIIDDRYEVLTRLATGGMAEVYLARLRGEEGFERAVVIKRMLPHLARDEQFRQMFLDEARIVARLSHPNIVHVHELVADNDELYLVMEYIEGESLSTLLDSLAESGGTLSPSTIVHILSSVAAGLHHAHDLKGVDGVPLEIVHRDVSPENVFVGYDGSVRLIDFGIAKARERATKTNTGTIKGKFAYMSPEQIQMHEVDRRSDVYACGVLLHEMATGDVLYEGPHVMIMQRVVKEPVPRLDETIAGFDSGLADIAATALAKDPAERFSTALALQRALRTVGAKHQEPELAEVVLAELMRRHYTDVITQKREMLRTPALASPTPILSTPPQERKAGVLLWLGVVALLLLLGGGLGVFAMRSNVVSQGGSDRTPEANGSVEQAPPPAEPPAEAPATPPPGETVEQSTEDETVRLEINTRPSGASVHVDGVERGESPLTLEVERGDIPLEIEARLPRHETFHGTFTPDENVRLDWVLQRTRRSGMRRGMDSSPAEMEPGFFRVN